MNFYKLRQFITVCDYENISKAAEVLYVSQPSLSRTITNLEKNLGCRLFERIGNKIVLNDNGKRFYVFAKETLTKYNTLCGSLQSDIKTRSENLRICYSDDLFIKFIIPMYLKQTNENINIQRVEDSLIEEELCADSYDVAFTTHTINNPELTNVLWLEKNTYVSVPSDHPLAKKERLFLKDLDNESFLYKDKSDANYQNFIKHFKIVAPNHKIINRAPEEAFNLLKNTFDGLYFISTEDIMFGNEQKTPGRVLIKVHDDSLKKERYLIHNRKANQKVTLLINWMHDNLYS